MTEQQQSEQNTFSTEDLQSLMKTLAEMNLKIPMHFVFAQLRNDLNKMAKTLFDMLNFFKAAEQKPEAPKEDVKPDETQEVAK
jgi:hypothetical protein